MTQAGCVLSNSVQRSSLWYTSKPMIKSKNAEEGASTSQGSRGPRPQVAKEPVVGCSAKVSSTQDVRGATGLGHVRLDVGLVPAELPGQSPAPGQAAEPFGEQWQVAGSRRHDKKGAMEDKRSIIIWGVKPQMPLFQVLHEIAGPHGDIREIVAKAEVSWRGEEETQYVRVLFGSPLHRDISLPRVRAAASRLGWRAVRSLSFGERERRTDEGSWPLNRTTRIPSLRSATHLSHLFYLHLKSALSLSLAAD